MYPKDYTKVIHMEIFNMVSVETMLETAVSILKQPEAPIDQFLVKVGTTKGYDWITFQ